MEEMTVLLPPNYEEQTITVSREDAYLKYACALGVTVQELTDSDRETAFVDAVIRAALLGMGA